MLPLKIAQKSHSPLQVIPHLIWANTLDLFVKQKGRRAVEASIFFKEKYVCSADFPIPSKHCLAYLRS